MTTVPPHTSWLSLASSVFRTARWQVDDWTCPMSEAQQCIMEAICRVLSALLRDLARTNKVDM